MYKKKKKGAENEKDVVACNSGDGSAMFISFMLLSYLQQFSA